MPTKPTKHRLRISVLIVMTFAALISLSVVADETVVSRTATQPQVPGDSIPDNAWISLSDNESIAFMPITTVGANAMITNGAMLAAKTADSFDIGFTNFSTGATDAPNETTGTAIETKKVEMQPTMARRKF